MKIILTTLNSKYTHTSLALRSIGNWLSGHGIQAEWLEYTINTPIYQIIGDLYRHQPDLLIFSVYIWNGEETRAIAAQLKKLMPETQIVFGGPEVSFDSESELQNSPFADFVISGEGEAVVEMLVKNLLKSDPAKNLSQIPGLTWRDGSLVKTNLPQQPIDMDRLVFPYPELESLENRILYYESSRGCPYSCSYCLSSATKGVRFRNVELVKTDLKRFMAAGVMQVKFIDRTFNANPDRALALWQYLSDEDNGHTNFHFEITAELLRPQDIELLSRVRPGLFQFEIGIQTTMKAASEAVNRRLTFEQLSLPVKTLLSTDNIHIHLDLIAGLPHEDYNRFLQSFDDVYRLNPQVLQLGFLKLIKGSGIRQQATLHGYVYEDYPPYEILENNYIKFDELLKLKDIEMCLDQLHNSKRFGLSLKVLLSHFDKPSQFFVGFSRWLRLQCHLDEAIKTEKWYELLWHFAQDLPDPQTLRLTLIADYMTSLGKQAPEWLSKDLLADGKADVFELAKSSEFEACFPHLTALSPKERVKRIRYAALSNAQAIKLVPYFKEKVIKLDRDSSQMALLIVELNEKHPVTELYPAYLFV